MKKITRTNGLTPLVIGLYKNVYRKYYKVRDYSHKFIKEGDITSYSHFKYVSNLKNIQRDNLWSNAVEALVTNCTH